MHSKSTTLDNLIDYFESLGIDINVGKNKARGNKGVFIFRRSKFRIDISKNIENPIPVLIHEFSHYVHSIYNKKLDSLDFIFDNITDEIMEELIEVTVQDVSKDFAKELFDKKAEINAQIKNLAGLIKNTYPDFKLSACFKKIENGINFPAKYLLKYDRVKIWNKVISVENIEKDCTNLTAEQIAYIVIKSKQRMLKRINSRISKLNRYYNSPTELFARFCEMYFTNPEKAQKLAPVSTDIMKKTLSENKIPEFSKLTEIMTPQNI